MTKAGRCILSLAAVMVVPMGTQACGGRLAPNPSGPAVATETVAAEAVDQPIYTVTSVKLQIVESTPRKFELRISASGETNTAGWRNIKLVAWPSKTPPRDGVYDFDMVGTPPSGMVAQVITPVTAEYAMIVPEGLKGVRVHSGPNATLRSVTEYIK